MSQENEWVTLCAPEIINLTQTKQVRVEVKQAPPSEDGKIRKGLSIREWFEGTASKTGPDKLKRQWHPTKKGVWIPIDKANEAVKAIMTVWANYQAKLQETL